MDWQEYQNRVKKYIGEEKKLIEKAFRFAEKLHSGQKRLSGEPFFSHPIAVSLKIAELNLDAITVAAALLHDSIEDGPTSLQTIKNNFGEETAFLVNGVTKADAVQYKGIKREVETLRRMFFAVSKDIRVVLIKLMDRLHNMETLEAKIRNKQKEIALETLEIYAPIADRLGMGDLKGKLEDLAFKYVYPDECGWILEQVKEKIPERQTYLEQIIPVIKKELRAEEIKTLSIHSRAKHYYSLWKKLLRYDMDWSRITDLIAVRIVVSDIEKCYHALGVIHKLWKPIPGRIKDYIALPKPNNYQSLHTTVFCVEGKMTEFQIRTPKMHEEAEYGIAAHWAWDLAGKPRKGVAVKNSMKWVEQMQNWQDALNQNRTSAKEFFETLKIDFFKDRIFVFTPKGDVVDLPNESTPVDFAYHIHSQIGDQTAAAKINGKLVPLAHPLSSGDVVEIITQKNKQPNREWLLFVKTSLAKNRIRGALRRKIRSLPAQKKDGEEIAMEIKAKNRVGLLRDISNVISLFRISIKKIASDAVKDASYPTISLAFTVKNKDQLERVKTKLKLVKGVEEIITTATK